MQIRHNAAGWVDFPYQKEDMLADMETFKKLICGLGLQDKVQYIEPSYSKRDKTHVYVALFEPCEEIKNAIQLAGGFVIGRDDGLGEDYYGFWFRFKSIRIFY